MTTRYWIIILLAVSQLAAAGEPVSVEIASSEDQYSNLTLRWARSDGTPGLAADFEGSDDLHYYARSETAPAPGLELKIIVESDAVEFAEPVFPKWHMFTDSLGSQVEVYEGAFTVFVPIEDIPESTATADVSVKIAGITCTSKVCLPPFEKELSLSADFSKADTWPALQTPAAPDESAPEPEKTQQTSTGPTYSFAFAMLLALVAGLALNVMPCVWPVLPLIVMRIVQQSKQAKGSPTVMGLIFCLGILLFFAALAAVNIVLQLFYGTVLGWGDPFRSPLVITAIVVLLVFLAMFMFGLLNFAVPSSIAGKSGSGKGYLGSLGMGFLAAVLSTPCGFGVLAAAFGWAQTQPLAISTLAIMVIGLGMALPYAVLTSVPGLLDKLPKPGRWMELIKQAMGFILLIIAVKFALALSRERLEGVMYFCSLLALAVWIWGTWIQHNTPAVRRIVIRLIAAAIVAVSGWLFLPQKTELIDWQPYDAARIAAARQQNRPVLIDFTAAWCLNCTVVDKLVYTNPTIAELIEDKNVLPIKADTTESDFPATIDLKGRYNESGTLPVNMLLMPGADEPLKWHGTDFKEQLTTALKQLQDTSADGEKEESL